MEYHVASIPTENCVCNEIQLNLITDACSMYPATEERRTLFGSCPKLSFVQLFTASTQQWKKFARHID